jgi:hypothetical protein
MKLLVITCVFLSSLFTHAIESVAANVDSITLKNDSFFSTTTAYFRKDSASYTSIVDNAIFNLNVVTSYTKKTTASSGSNIFRVRVQLLGATNQVIPLISNETEYKTTKYDVTVNTFKPLVTKSINFSLTPAAALSPGVAYKIHVIIEREELVSAERVWVSDVASMKKDLPLSSTGIPVPNLNIQSVSGGNAFLQYKPNSAQQGVLWKLQASTTLASGSFLDVSGVTFVLDEETDLYEANVPVNTTTQPKRFFRLVAP